MTLRSVLVKVIGQLDSVPQRLIVNETSSLVEELLDQSIERWASTNWYRCDNEEVNCTIQLYRWADDACRTIPMFAALRVCLESSLPTPQMIQGTVSAKTMTRPDLRVHVGDAGISVECKRLGTRRGQPHDYVYKGIDRFVSGNYADRSAVGFMVGYVRVTQPAKCVQDINERITSHPAMGSSDCLSLFPSRAGHAARYRSHHTRSNTGSVRLEHFLVSLP